VSSAFRNISTMPPVMSEEDSQLIAELQQLSQKGPKLVKSSTYSAPSAPEIMVRSWKMNEHKYYDVPSPFPTLARGIFSVQEGDVKSRIVARGYDKFFNIGEVPWTTVSVISHCLVLELMFPKWPSLEIHTAPPYTLSLKSNGCIIFISALTAEKLLICSKHSIGPVAGSPESHAEAGERWLNKHLRDSGKTIEQLASTLWEKNWTAIAEVRLFSCNWIFLVLNTAVALR
jgi:tRNA ligase